MSAVAHPRVPARRGRAWAGRWWAKAWLRAVEEVAYDEGDLRRARSLARSGAVGAVRVDAGSLRSAVTEQRRGAEELWGVEVALPVLDPSAVAALVEAVAADPARVAALLAGELPHDLVEHAEEAGVELVPYGTELAASCTCASWVDPCPHALALLLQVGWLVEDDPLVLLQLRGLPREDLLAALHHRRDPQPGPGPGRDDAEEVLETAEDAARRAARILDLLGHDHDPAELDRLW
ncbi:hypothetical protein ENKNEFLB_00097 [Nocardioides aquaticus]|uniref:SWIM-type domain-containing protein n=1 Tax=Nocardioides aquaticus TaxID=160826 RepID=A0ABX8EFA7_9ACTN|nr:SWIM zinc finger family protein [Nocardioides aquaticus]QVT77732.1 hypothetical protein ENKNEFLB_00097 [Nocardioides aquaticus]